MELMRLYNTYLGPASTTLLDLGAAGTAWNNLYLQGTNSSSVIDASTMFVVRVFALSSQTVGATFTGATIGTGNIGLLNVTSKMSVRLMTSSPLSVTNGDTWFESSSNLMYLFIRSNNLNFYVAMNT